MKEKHGVEYMAFINKHKPTYLLLSCRDHSVLLLSTHLDTSAFNFNAVDVVMEELPEREHLAHSGLQE